MKQIRSCYECPFYEPDSETPTATCRAADRGGTFSGMPVAGLNTPPHKRGTPPEWCPARGPNGFRVVLHVKVD